MTAQIYLNMIRVIFVLLLICIIIKISKKNIFLATLSTIAAIIGLTYVYTICQRPVIIIPAKTVFIPEQKIKISDFPHSEVIWATQRPKGEMISYKRQTINITLKSKEVSYQVSFRIYGSYDLYWNAVVAMQSQNPKIWLSEKMKTIGSDHYHQICQFSSAKNGRKKLDKLIRNHFSTELKNKALVIKKVKFLPPDKTTKTTHHKHKGRLPRRPSSFP